MVEVCRLAKEQGKQVISQVRLAVESGLNYCLVTAAVQKLLPIRFHSFPVEPSGIAGCNLNKGAQDIIEEFFIIFPCWHGRNMSMDVNYSSEHEKETRRLIWQVT